MHCLGHTDTESIIYLKLKFSWASYVASHNPVTKGAGESASSPCASTTTHLNLEEVQSSSWRRTLSVPGGVPVPRLRVALGWLSAQMRISVRNQHFPQSVKTAWLSGVESIWVTLFTTTLIPWWDMRNVPENRIQLGCNYDSPLAKLLETYDTEGQPEAN